MKKRTVVFVALGVLLLSFAGTDFYLRGEFYYTKRVVNFLYQNTWQAVFPSHGSVTLFVRMHADQGYRRANPDWEDRLRRAFDAAAARFAHDFDIRFRLLNIVPWERPAGVDDLTGLLRHAARGLDRRAAQITVIMSDAGGAAGPGDAWRDAGVAHRLGDILVVGDEAVLLHELGHLFGAVDYEEGDPRYEEVTTYSYKYADRTEAVDPANRARILKHKHRLLW
jgi:hypothetical protein